MTRSVSPIVFSMRHLVQLCLTPSVLQPLAKSFETLHAPLSSITRWMVIPTLRKRVPTWAATRHLPHVRASHLDPLENGRRPPGWDWRYCLFGGEVGVSLDAVRRTCLRAARWAAETPLTETLAPWGPRNLLDR